MSVNELCSHNVATCSPETSIRAAATMMADWGVGTLVVVREDRTLAGIVTDRDLVVRVLAAPDADVDAPVSTVMTGGPASVAIGSELRTAVAIMRSNSVRRMVVVDADRRPIGVLSLDDVLRRLVRELRDAVAVIEQQDLDGESHQPRAWSPRLGGAGHPSPSA